MKIKSWKIKKILNSKFLKEKKSGTLEADFFFKYSKH